MDQSRSLKCSVSEFLALINQTLEFAYPTVEVEGEVASFKVNQGKYVFFDLKDETGTLNCFMTVWQLRMPIEDGMKIVVTATPKVTQWGKFSLTVRALRPTGSGSIKKSFELLKAKLEKEGLFAPERKRAIPYPPQNIAVISSTGAAGYADFVKILGDRWGGINVTVAHVQVQGADAPAQIIRALDHFNEHAVDYDVVALLRGGGSADDLAVFNDEPLVRAVAASRLPTITGIGHEVDTSLVDLVADRMAATPSNAAQLLVPDRQELLRTLTSRLDHIVPRLYAAADALSQKTNDQTAELASILDKRVEQLDQSVNARRNVLAELDPTKVLARGYAFVRGVIDIGEFITIETAEAVIQAEVENVRQKN